MPMDADDFSEGLGAFHKRLHERCRAAGPAYVGDGKFRPTVWHDQKFASHVEPSGIVNCPQALAVGRTLQALDVMIIASASNEEAVVFPAGSTITLSFLQGDREDGVFEDVGPTICVKAPAKGMSAEPGDIVARFPMCDFNMPWLMTTLEFSGAITGGTVDCILSYNPR